LSLICLAVVTAVQAACGDRLLLGIMWSAT